MGRIRLRRRVAAPARTLPPLTASHIRPHDTGQTSPSSCPLSDPPNRQGAAKLLTRLISVRDGHATYVVVIGIRPSAKPRRQGLREVGLGHLVVNRPQTIARPTRRPSPSVKNRPARLTEPSPVAAKLIEGRDYRAQWDA